MFGIRKQPVEKPKETVVATMSYLTNFIKDDGTPNGVSALHCLLFTLLGDERKCRIDSSNDHLAADKHPNLCEDSFNWRMHGNLPKTAIRVEKNSNVSVLQLVK